MNCHSCGRSNHRDFLVCACGARRVIAPPGTAPQSPPPAAPTAKPTPPRFARDVTRYLCAAVQTDARINQKTISSIVDEPRRAIASTPGVDLVTVLKYALAARRRHTVRDVVLLCSIAGFALVHVLVLPVPSPELLLFLLAWAVVCTEGLWADYRVLAPRLRREVFDPAAAPEPPGKRMRDRLAEIGRLDRGNTTVFAQSDPFSSEGRVVHKWSFGLNVAARGASPGAVRRFTVHDLYEHITGEVRTLDVPGTTVEDRLYVGGLDLLHHFSPEVRGKLLPDLMRPPVSDVDEDTIRELREDPKCRARPYLAIRVHGWGGEVVQTLLFRFALFERSDLLFVEAVYSVLPPVQDRYRKVDRLQARPSMTSLPRTLINTAARAPFALLLSAPRLLSRLITPLAGSLNALFDTPSRRSEQPFNYGALLSPRTLASDHRLDHFFQRQDREMYVKLAERRVLESLTEFLARHDVDTSELDERQTTILNQGVWVSGQSAVTVGSLSLGKTAISISKPGDRQYNSGGARR